MFGNRRPKPPEGIERECGYLVEAHRCGKYNSAERSTMNNPLRGKVTFPVERSLRARLTSRALEVRGAQNGPTMVAACGTLSMKF
jgi:hypothetical protein